MDSSTNTGLAMGACPPLEDIAAFLDGMLPAEERERIVAHLADCEACYQMFAGAADFLTEAGPSAEKAPETVAKPRGKVVPFPFANKPHVPWWLAAAALVVLGLGIGLPTYRSYNSRPELTVAGLTEPVQDERGLARYLYIGTTYRGPAGSGDDLTSTRPAFMVGIQLVDLGLSSKTKDIGKASDILQRIGNELDNFIGAEDLQERYYKESIELKQAPRHQALAHLDRIAAEIPTREGELNEAASFPESLAFGKWIEAGRLAASLKDPEFFEDRTNRRFLSWLLRQVKEPEPETLPVLKTANQHFFDWLLHRDGVPLDPEVLDSLQKIQETLAKENLHETDYQALKASFDGIIGHYAP